MRCLSNIKTCAFYCRNELERQFLEMLQFNINVPSSVYAKYYFDLRALADAHDLSFPLEPLSRERAAKLEVCACICIYPPRCHFLPSYQLHRYVSSFVVCALR